MNAALSKWAIVAGVSMVVTAVGIVIQWKSGISNAKVPVGAIVLVLLAILSVLRLWRWTPVVGAAFCVFILVTAFILGGVFTRLGHPAQIGAFWGTLLQMLGLVSTIVIGILTTVCNV